MAIRPLRDVWIDANFKETQLHYLRIGQAADLYIDIYGDRHVFKGRVTGFTTRTGSSLTLLPEDYDADKNPLFIGTSVVPYIYLNRPPTGPNAGKVLQAYVPRSPASKLSLTRSPTPTNTSSMPRCVPNCRSIRQ